MARDTRKRIYYLSISSWAGVAIGASHVYATVKFTDDAGKYVSQDVEHKTTWAERFPFKEVPPGQAERGRCVVSNAYKDKSEAIAAGKRWFRRNAAPGSVLLLGRNSVVEPFPILVGPVSIRAKAAKLLAEYHKVYPEGARDALDWKAVDRITDAFEKLIASVLQ